MNLDENLDYLVLQAVADDFENFEMILCEIAKWTAESAAIPDSHQVTEALIKAIDGNQIKVYETSERNELVQASFNQERMTSLWFYITKQGKVQMEKLEEKANRT